MTKITEEAKEIITKKFLNGKTLDKISEETGFSKGSIFNSCSLRLPTIIISKLFLSNSAIALMISHPVYKIITSIFIELFNLTIIIFDYWY